MKTNQRTLVLGLLILCVAWTGCLFTPPKEKPKGDEANYAEDLSVPDSLIFNLLESYSRREIDPYANLLARDYEFEFQTPDNDFPNGMNFTQDSTSTYNMFTSKEVTLVDLTMNTTLPVNARYKGEDTKLVSIANLLLRIHTNIDNTIFEVNGDIQDYHMILGKEANGEDPTRYYVRAWVDIAGSTAPRREPLLTRINKAMASDDEGDKVVQITMSELHRHMPDFHTLITGSN